MRADFGIGGGDEGGHCGLDVQWDSQARFVVKVASVRGGVATLNCDTLSGPLTQQSTLYFHSLIPDELL